MARPAASGLARSLLRPEAPPTVPAPWSGDEDVDVESPPPPLPSLSDEGPVVFGFAILIFIVIAVMALLLHCLRRRQRRIQWERQQQQQQQELPTAQELALQDDVGKEIEFTAEEADALQEYLGNDFVCPISRDVFHNPVIAADGKTYDFKYIREWLRVRQVSPLTNMSMAHYNLEPNVAVRNQIEKSLTDLREQGELVGTLGTSSARPAEPPLPVVTVEAPPRETDEEAADAFPSPKGLPWKI
mmetsp:Transcript_10015/g.36619  ORF Transcript_10015/g.36619 Transcript_10015/m.36619 type:complete len:244 (+) Transcript_10015:206-937(+)